MNDAASHERRALTGNAVINAQGVRLGKVEELMIDLEEGRVAYALLSFDAFQGLGDRLFALPWEALTVDAERHAFVVDVDRKRLETAPGFDPENAYPRLLWSPALSGKTPIRMVNVRAWRPGVKNRLPIPAQRTMAFAESPFRVHR